jgi:hypothetical protein
MSTRNEGAYRAGVGAGSALETGNSGNEYTTPSYLDTGGCVHE